MPPPKKSLGRGLNTLISGSLKNAITASAKKDADAAAPVAGSAGAAPSQGSPAKNAPVEARTSPWQEIPVHKIIPARGQSRSDFNEAEINELAESIQSVGLIQPIVVRKVSEGYELIAGERRLRAFKKLALKSIPALVRGTTSDEGAIVMTLVENLQRKDLNPIEEAVGYATLMRDYNLTQDTVAERVGKPRTTIANSVRLLSLDREIQAYLIKGMLSAGHGKAILGLDDAAQRVVAARRIVESGASVRMAEAIVKKLKNSSVAANTRPETAAPATAAEITAAISDIEKRLISHLNTSVRVKHSARQGKIVIEYYGNEDLRRILEKVGLPS